MYVCMYVCIYVCIYICIYIYIYIYIYMMYLYMYVCVCVCVCIYISIYIYTHTYIGGSAGVGGVDSRAGGYHQRLVGRHRPAPHRRAQLQLCPQPGPDRRPRSQRSAGHAVRLPRRLLRPRTHLLLGCRRALGGLARARACSD